MKKSSPLLALLITALPAGAASSFSEDFSAMALPVNMTESGGTPIYTGSDASFGGNSRYYLRTNETDYAMVDFVAEGTVTLTSVNPNSTAFFGMGPGDRDPSAFDTPVTPSIFAEIAPTAFANGFVRYNDNGGVASGNGGLNDQGGAWGAGTVHRVRLTWTAATRIAVFELDQSYDGVTFTPDWSATYDGATTSASLDSSDNGFDATNSAIFFGTGNGSSWDDIIVTVAASGPPNIVVPASLRLAPDGTVQQYDITVANTSTDNALEVADTSSFTGTNAGAFSFVTTLPLTVGTSSSETLTIQFDPAGLSGPVSATLNLDSNDPVNSPSTITISGVVHDPVNVVSETRLDFGSAGSGDPAVDLPLDIGNDGTNEDLTISATTISGPGAAAFSVETDPASTVAPGGTTQMTVRYDPSVIAGRAVATLTIDSNDPVNPAANVTLTGVTPLSPASFSDDFATFGLPSLDNPWDADSTNGRAEFLGGANADRTYLRTVAADFNKVDFTATVDLHRTGGGGIGSIFFGIGNGETPPDANTSAPWGEPATGEYIYLRIRGDAWTDELGDVNSNTDGTIAFGLPNAAIGTDIAAQMAFVASTGTATITLDIDGNGFDGADPAVASSNLNLSDTDSHIFVGGAGGVWADNLVVTVGPPEGLKLEVEQIADDMLRFTWNSRAGKRYNLLSETALTADPATWTPLESGISATPDTNMLEIVRPSGDARRFYAIQEEDIPDLLNEGFESGKGGFTMVDHSAGGAGSDWVHGMPESSGDGGAVTTGNGDSTNCWGTNIGAPGFYATGTDTSLISPVLDLTDVAGATLSFAQAIDILTGDTLVVNVLDDTTDTVLQAAIHTSTPDGDIATADWETISSIAITGGEPVRIEWRFTGNNDGTYLGAYIDDVVVTPTN